jgi:hypothetical protein
VVDGRYVVIASSLSPEVRAAVWDLRETGESLRSIARRLDQPCHLLTALVTPGPWRRDQRRVAMPAKGSEAENVGPEGEEDTVIDRGWLTQSAHAVVFVTAD